MPTVKKKEAWQKGIASGPEGRALDLKVRTTDAQAETVGDKGLVPDLEKQRNLSCWILKLLGTSNPFLSSIFSLLQWDVCNCYTMPIPPLYLENRELVSSFTVPETERNFFPRMDHIQSLTKPRLDGEIGGLSWLYLAEVWGLSSYCNGLGLLEMSGWNQCILCVTDW